MYLLNIKKTSYRIPLLIFVAILACLPIVLQPTVHGETEDNEAPSFIFCIDTSRSMERFEDEIKNLLDTYEYIADCSYVKPNTKLMHFSYKLNTVETLENSSMSSIISSIDFENYTNIENSIIGINEYLKYNYNLEDDAKKLENTTLIYISDCKATLGDKYEINFESENYIQYIRSYLIKFDSTTAAMEYLLKDKTKTTNTRENDIYLYNFIDYVVNKLDGYPCKYESNRPNAEDELYSQLFYILNKKAEDADGETFLNKDFFETPIVSGTENEFLSTQVNFKSEMYFYNSILTSIHETTEEALKYIDNEPLYDVYSFAFPKPGIFLSSDINSIYRKMPIEFRINSNTELDSIINESDNELSYRIYNSETNELCSQAKVENINELIKYSTDKMGKYKAGLYLEYSTKLFDEDYDIQRTVKSKDYCYFEVSNYRPICPLGISAEISMLEGESIEIPLAQYFNDADDDPLVYSINSENLNQHYIKNAQLYITGDTAGIEEIVVVATDIYDKSAQFTFLVEVTRKHNLILTIAISLSVVIVACLLIYYLFSKK